MFIQGVDGIQFLEILRLRVPFACWLLAVDCPQLLEDVPKVPDTHPSHGVAVGGSLTSGLSLRSSPDEAMPNIHPV